MARTGVRLLAALAMISLFIWQVRLLIIRGCANIVQKLPNKSLQFGHMYLEIIGLGLGLVTSAFLAMFSATTETTELH